MADVADFIFSMFDASGNDFNELPFVDVVPVGRNPRVPIIIGPKGLGRGINWLSQCVCQMLGEPFWVGGSRTREKSYPFAFLGIPKHSVVCISTHGAIKKDSSNGNIVRECFAKGLRVMLETIEPRTVLVYGRMPDDIFGPYLDKYAFVRYPSEFEKSRKKGGS